jgi:hypothetical protein
MRATFTLPPLLLAIAAACAGNPSASQPAPCRTGRVAVVDWRGQGTVEVIWSTETLRARYLPTDRAVERGPLTAPGTFTFLARITPGTTRIDLPTDLRDGFVVVVLPTSGRVTNPPNSVRTRIEECQPAVPPDSTP